MSIHFIDPNGTDLWNPGNLTGRLFHDQVESVARYLGVASGLGPIVSDEVAVNGDQFASLARSYADLLEHSHLESGAHLILENCFCLVAALAEKLGTRWDGNTDIERWAEIGRRIVG